MAIQFLTMCGYHQFLFEVFESEALSKVNACNEAVVIEVSGCLCKRLVHEDSSHYWCVGIPVSLDVCVMTCWAPSR